MDTVNRQILLASRPEGVPKESDFRLAESPIGSPGEGECLVRGVYLSVDPYMRGRLRDRKSYAPPVQIGDVMVGGVAGRVVESHHPDFSAGDEPDRGRGEDGYRGVDGRAIGFLHGEADGDADQPESRECRLQEILHLCRSR